MKPARRPSRDSGSPGNDAVRLLQMVERPQPTKANIACRPSRNGNTPAAAELRDAGPSATTRTSWPKHAWFRHNAKNQPQKTAQRLNNAFILHDMHGNVLEWCADLYAPDYYQYSPEADPPGAKEDMAGPSAAAMSGVSRSIVVPPCGSRPTPATGATCGAFASSAPTCKSPRSPPRRTSKQATCAATTASPAADNRSPSRTSKGASRSRLAQEVRRRC